MQNSSLSFRWRNRDLDHVLHIRLGAAPTSIPFLDFEVDGVSLYDVQRKHGLDYISFLGAYDADNENQSIRRLLLEEPPDPYVDHPELYVCPECADLGCGAMTVKVERSDGFLTWREFYYECLSDPPDVLEGVGPFTFPKDEYEKALRAAVALTAAKK